MPGIEEMLANALRPEGGSATHEAQAAPVGEAGFDVASFVDECGKTASLLTKAAEALPSSPQLVAAQLKMLDNPMSVSREVTHDLQARKFFLPALPQAGESLRVPSAVEDIQKQASARDYLAKR